MKMNPRGTTHRRELDYEFFRIFDDILQRAEAVAHELQNEVEDVKKDSDPGEKKNG